MAKEVSKSVNEGKSILGVLVCGSGQGMCMTANKFHKVRAGLCWNQETAELSRQHNNANIICLPGRMLSFKEAEEIVETFFNTNFSNEERHIRRINKMRDCSGKK